MTTVNAHDKAAQERFDAKYITTGELCRRLGMGRVGLHKAVHTGRLPGAVLCEGGPRLWERGPVLDAAITKLSKTGAGAA